MEMTEKFTELQATDESLDAFEHRIQGKLPLSYRAFLKQHNGGRPHRRKFSFPGPDNKMEAAAIHYFYALHDGQVGNLASAFDNFNDRLPLFHLPIARDAFGNLIVIPLRKTRDVPVYFWDHEEELSEENHSAVLHKISPSFISFTESLGEG